MLKDTDDVAWRRASPYSVLFFLGRTIRLLAKNAAQVLAPLAAYLVAFGGDLQSKLTVIAVVLAIGVALVSVLRYWFFRFSIGTDAVLIRDGIVRKRQLDIKFDRIQGINTEQNIVYRYLGLVTVSFDTAGSAGSEAELPAVPTALAESLRDSIGKHDGAAGASPEEREERTMELLRLNAGDMVRIGLADRRALVIFAVIAPLMEQIGDRGRQLVADFAEDAARRFGELDAQLGFALLAVSVVAVLVLLAVLSVAAAFLRYHDFRLVKVGDRLRARAGLLTRHENALDLGKIQVVRLTQGIVLGFFRRFRLQARSATSGGRQQSDRILTVPVADDDFANEFLRLALAPEAGTLPSDPRDAGFTGVSRRYMLPRIFLFAVLPAVTGFLVFLPTEGAAALLTLAWVPVGSLLVYRAWRRCGFALDADGLVRRVGLFGYRLDAFLFRKVQRVTLRQSWFQRRRRLANVQVFLASGHVTIPYIGLRMACDLQDYMLYKSESSLKAWH